ncbi:MAG: hypothetical protein AABZ55_11290, partial [Bdellovibrionota bacterium]
MKIGTRFRILFLIGFSHLLSLPSWADAPGAPGMPHRWPHALKEAVGTAYEETGSASPVWFTIADGILSEIFYPTVDRPQVSDLQFLVTDGEKYFSEQKRDCVSTVTYSGEGMAVRITGREKSGKYQFEQWVVTAPA